ncbi:hypothetical protein KBB68_02590 [Candidatus Babeliales bacterium]|nr:hypothetical protein [Candidatus Babeliales bacterium]
MNFKLFFLQIMSVFVLTQSGIYAMYSATPAAYRSFGGARFKAPAIQTSGVKDSLNREVGWGSRLEYLMNPQANPYNPQAKIPTATLQPETLQLVANQPRELQLVANQPRELQLVGNQPREVQLVGNQPRELQLVANQPRELQLVGNQPREVQLVTNQPRGVMAVPAASMNFSVIPYQNYRYPVLNVSTQNFVQRLFAELNNLDAMYATIDILKPEEYHLKRRALLSERLQELNFLKGQLDSNDVKGQSTLLNMQTFIQASLDVENYMIKEYPARRRRAESDQREKRIRQIFLNREAEQLDKELSSGMPVENPYEQVRQDFKNQFTRGAKIGAAGAGTLYGLKKYKEANNS